MLDKKVSDLLNEQINKELYSAYLYLDMSDYYAYEGLDGFANWYEVQAREELDHAMLIKKYLLDNGEKVTLTPIAQPPVKFKEYADPAVSSLKHEQYVTALINNIYREASAINDYRTADFLNWFVREQAEEEKSADDMIKKMELFGSDPKSLYLLNAELRGRVYAPPTTPAQE